MIKAFVSGLVEDIGGLKGVLRFIILCSLASILLLLDLITAWHDPSLVNRNGWIGVILTASVYGVAITGMLLLLPRKICKIVSATVFGWVLFFSIVGLVTQRQFGMVFRGETIMILAGSSLDEIKEFLMMYATLKWIVGSLLFVACEVIVVFCLARCDYFRYSRKLLILALICFLPIMGWLRIFPVHGRTALATFRAATYQRFGSFSVWENIYNSLAQLNDLSEAAKNPDLPETIDCHADSTTPLLGVVVIGESSTRNRWSLYGYGKDTNPLLMQYKDELMIFNDLVSVSSGTTECLRHLLTAATCENEKCKYTFTSICQRAGYYCSFLSNQGHWGQFDGVDTILFKDCDKKFWLGDVWGAGTPDNPRYDGYLLPYIMQDIKESNANRTTFVHLIGSHSEVKDKCPPSFAAFGLNNENVLKDDITKSEQYDNSIIYTDYMLCEIIKFVKERGGASFLIYLSDHGESPSSKYWRFVEDQDVWEIPMFIWMSEEYKTKYPDIVEQVKKSVNKPLVSDQLLFGLTRLFLIDGLPDYKEEEDFLSDKFIPREKRYNEKVQGVK